METRSIVINVPADMAEGLPDQPIDLEEDEARAIVAILSRWCVQPEDPAEALVELRLEERSRRQREQWRDEYRRAAELYADDSEVLDRLWPPFRLTGLWRPTDEPAEPWEERPIAMVRAYYEEVDRQHAEELEEARQALTGVNGQGE